MNEGSPSPFGVAAAAVARAAAARPRTALGALAGLAALALAAAATWLGVDADSTRLLSPDLPFQQRAHALDAAFPALKTSLIVIAESEAPEAAEAALGALAADLAPRPEIAGVFAPSADPFYRTSWPLHLETGALDAALARLSTAAPLIAALRATPTTEGFLAAVDEAGALAEAAAFEPAALDRLYAEAAGVWRGLREGAPRPFSWRAALGAGEGGAGRPLLMLVEPRPDRTRLSPARPALDAIAAATARLDPALARLVSISVTGEPALRAEEMRGVLSGLGLSFAVSLAAVAAILAVALRSARRAALAVGFLLVVIALTAGVATAAVGALNLISFAFVVLMTGIGEDYLVHFLFQADEEARRLPPAEAAAAAAGRLGGSMALAAATTALAFAAFAVTDFAGMAQLGLIGAAGVVLALVVTLVGAPAAAALWPGIVRPRPLTTVGRARPPRAPPGLIGLVAAALALAATPVALGARFDADPLNLRDPDSASVRAFRALAADPATTPYRLSVLAPDAREAAAIAEALRPLPEVAEARWLGDLIPADQEAKLERLDLAWPSLAFAVEGEAAPLAEPAAAGAVRERLAARLGAPGAGPGAAAFAAELAAGDPGPAPALEAELFRFLPPLLDRLAGALEAGPVAAADLPPALVARFRSPDGLHRVEVAPSGDMADPAAMRAFVAATAAAATPAGGPDQIVGAARAVGGAMLTATVFAALGIAGLTLLATRSALTTAAVLAPLAAAGVATAAASVLLDAPFNYANAIVAPLLIGLGVDGGVYMAEAAKTDPARVFETPAPGAAAASVATTVAAFGSLALSDHRGVASMGILLTVALAATLAATLALTPAILALGRERRP